MARVRTWMTLALILLFSTGCFTGEPAEDSKTPAEPVDNSDNPPETAGDSTKASETEESETTTETWTVSENDEVDCKVKMEPFEMEGCSTKEGPEPHMMTVCDGTCGINGGPPPHIDLGICCDVDEAEEYTVPYICDKGKPEEHEFDMPMRKITKCKCHKCFPIPPEEQDSDAPEFNLEDIEGFDPDFKMAEEPGEFHEEGQFQDAFDDEHIEL